MPDYDQIVKIKEDAESKLRSLPGVHAVGIGKKSVGGKFTNDLAITVFVTEKKPLDQLSPAEVIPAEIDGVKTDVVQTPIPQLISTGNPANLVATVSGNQLSVTFTGKNIPGGGLLVVLDYSFAPTGSPATHFVESYQPASWETLNDIATAFANALTQRNLNSLFTVAPAGPTLTFTAAANFTVTITSCVVTAVDDTRYVDDHLRGGIQIQAGSLRQGQGTIGFLATTAVTPQDPQGKVVAVTCQHVVCPPVSQTSNLVSAVAGNQIAFGLNTSDPIPLNTLVEVTFSTLQADVFYSTLAGDTPDGVANGIVSAVTVAALPGISASKTASAQVTFVLPAFETLSCNVYGPATIDPDSDLIATVVGAAVTFTGEVSGDDYGIFTSVDAGGLRPTCGVYTNPAKGATLSSIATAVADAINKLPANVKGPVTATATANTINFGHTETVQCVVKSDMEVGQPDNSFGSPCSHCCSHRIGRVIDSKVDVDVAVIQLDAGQKWVPEIEGVGILSGVHPLSPSDLHLTVVTRGRTLSKEVFGRIDALQVSGQAGLGRAFQRRYVNSIMITSTQPNNDPFALPGDSGSAIADVLGGVMGIVFAGGDQTAIAAPIDAILTDAFPDLDLNPAPAPEAGHAPGDIRTVPKSAMAAASDADGAVIASPRPSLDKRLVQVEKEISATPEGFEYTELVKRHFTETQRLVNGNRRVATAWYHNGGPQILQAFLNMLQRRDQRLPVAIDGKPFADCVERMRRVFARYASPALAADLSRFAPRLETFAGLSYPQILASLRSESGD